MPDATTALFGRCELRVLDPGGRIRRRAARPNTVLDAGRRFAASALLSVPSSVRLEIVVGQDHATKTTRGMTKLAKQLAQIRVEEPALEGDQVVLQAHYDPPAPTTVGESGVLIRYRKVGGGNQHFSVLYNRAVLPGGIELADGESLALTWTIGFAAAPA